MATYVIFISKLQVLANIGICSYESKRKQPLYIDLKIEYNADLKEDNIKGYINYSSLACSIYEYFEKKQFKLIEHAAEYICSNILEKYNVENIIVTVKKPRAICNAKYASITITRNRIKKN